MVSRAWLIANRSSSDLISSSCDDTAVRLFTSVILDSLPEPLFTEFCATMFTRSWLMVRLTQWLGFEEYHTVERCFPAHCLSLHCYGKDR